MLSLVLALCVHAAPPPSLHLLPALDDESFVGLGPEQLIERRRLLLEDRPSLAPSVGILVAGGVLLVGGGSFAALSGEKAFGHDIKDAGIAAGVVAAAVGLAAVVFGAVWLIRQLGVRSRVNARIDEIDSLIELKSRANQTRLEASPGGLALRF